MNIPTGMLDHHKATNIEEMFVAFLILANGEAISK